MYFAAFFMVVGSLTVMCTKDNKPIIYSFALNKTLGINLENACINKNTGKLYVGARNRLYQLGGDLRMEKEVNLQPEVDDINCNINSFCNFPKNLTEIYSKVILVDYAGNMLIHCITPHNGICLKRDLGNITKPVKQFYIPVVANTDHASTFAFIAPGPITEEIEKVLPVLNVGVEHSKESDFPTFTSRSLYNFKPIVSHSSFYSRRYVYGFSSGGYSYMIRVREQIENYSSEIIRVCQDDQQSVSFSIIELQCRLNGTLYNLAQSAYLGKAGIQLASTMNIFTEDDVLFVSFSKGKPNSNMTTEQSVLCIYPMSSVRHKFEENIQGCVGEEDNIESVKCTKIKAMYDYCHNEEGLVFQDGKIPIVGKAAVTFDSLLTSLLVDVVASYTIAYAGNNKGHIVKVTIETITSATVFEDVDLGEGYSIKSSMFFDVGHEYIYAMTDYKIIKIKLYDCCQFTNCQTCSQAGKPYCGWCTLENRCSLHKDCIYRDEVGWLHFNGTSCPKDTEDSEETLQSPILTSIEPSFGPQAGGTHVSVTGENLNFGIYAPITIGGFCCHPISATDSYRNISSSDTSDFLHTNTFSSDSDALHCKTHVAYKSLVNKPLNVTLGGAEVSGDNNLTFTYLEDPSITSIEPKTSFQSGGRTLTIRGSNLLIVQKPRIYIMYNGVRSCSEICKGDKQTGTLLCPTPRLKTADHSYKNPDSSYTVYHDIDVGFEMDNVAAVTDKNLPVDVRSMVYYTDPVLEILTNVIQVNGSRNNITLKGKHLTFAATKSDVTVSIGCKVCTVVTLTATTIVCKPPADKPICDQSKDQKFSINVSIGYFHQHIGYVEYISNTIPRNGSILAVIIFVAVAVILIFTVTTIVYCKCRHKQKAVLNMVMFKNDNSAEGVGLIQDDELNL